MKIGQNCFYRALYPKRGTDVMMTSNLHSFCALILFSVLRKVHIIPVIIPAIWYVVITIRRCLNGYLPYGTKLLYQKPMV